MLDEYDQLRKDYRTERDRIIEVSLANNKEEAFVILAKAKTLREKIEKNLAELVAYEKEKVDDFVRESSGLYAKSVKAMIMLTCIGF